MNLTTRQVPAAACRMVVGEFELGENGADAKTAPIKMVARSGRALEHWYWGKVVHDLSGMTTHKPRLVIDYCHYDKEVIGYLNHFEQHPDADGIPAMIVSGALVPFKDSDRATEIIYKARAGVPYEASIDFVGGDPGDTLIEEVAEGASAEVNGYTLGGPATIFRKWPLRGVAVCPYGADMHTESQLSGREAEQVTITVANMTPTEGDVTMQDQKPAEAAQLQAAVETEPVVEAAVEAPETPAAEVAEPESPAVEPVEAAAEAAVETEATEATEPVEPVEPAPAEAVAPGQAFLDAYGDKGAVWFAQGKTFDEARELHVAELTAENKRLTDANAELTDKMAALRGEPSPVSFQAETPPNPHAAALGDNLGRFANGIKMPKR